MRFLWKSQLRSERGVFKPKSLSERKKITRKERLDSPGGFFSGPYVPVFFLWSLFFGTSIYMVLFSPYLALGEPPVEGLERIDESLFQNTVETILSQRYLGSISRNRFFLVQPEDLERRLREQYPLIRNITVKRTFPDTLHISVKERDSLLLWCSADICAHVLEDGSVIPVTDVYQEEANLSRTIFLKDESGQSFRQGAHVFDPKYALFPGQVRQALLEQLGIETENEMTLTSRFANEQRVKTKEGWEIYFGTELPLEKSLRTLELVLEKEIPAEERPRLSYIDLRIENRVFYRYQDGVENPQVTPAEEVKIEKKKEKKK